MKVKLAVFTAGAGLFLAALPALAHHSFAAEYDGTKRVTLKGKVTAIELINPHSWIHINVMNEKTGKMENWDCEFGPPNGLYRNGWTKKSVQIGDDIVIAGSLAKNGTNTVNANMLTTADGKRLFAGSSEGNASSGAPGAAAPPNPNKQ
jgi:hypothetical protein